MTRTTDEKRRIIFMHGANNHKLVFATQSTVRVLLSKFNTIELGQQDWENKSSMIKL